VQGRCRASPLASTRPEASNEKLRGCGRRTCAPGLCSVVLSTPHLSRLRYPVRTDPARLASPFLLASSLSREKKPRKGRVSSLACSVRSGSLTTRSRPHPEGGLQSFVSDQRCFRCHAPGSRPLLAGELAFACSPPAAEPGAAARRIKLRLQRNQKAFSFLSFARKERGLLFPCAVAGRCQSQWREEVPSAPGCSAPEGGSPGGRLAPLTVGKK